MGTDLYVPGAAGHTRLLLTVVSLLSFSLE